MYDIFSGFFLCANFFLVFAQPPPQISNGPSLNRHSLQGRTLEALFDWGGGGARAEGPRKFLNLESLKCHFLDFG